MQASGDEDWYEITVHEKENFGQGPWGRPYIAHFIGKGEHVIVDQENEACNCGAVVSITRRRRCTERADWLWKRLCGSLPRSVGLFLRRRRFQSWCEGAGDL